MIESWRWFGPLDEIELKEIYQTGSNSIVTALHDISYGEVWSISAYCAKSRLTRPIFWDGNRN